MVGETAKNSVPTAVCSLGFFGEGKHVDQVVKAKEVRLPIYSAPVKMLRCASRVGTQLFGPVGGGECFLHLQSGFRNANSLKRKRHQRCKSKPPVILRVF